jgi:transcriptional regulator with XRE-family HTH domain
MVMKENPSSPESSHDDFASDIRFGEWLRAQRNHAGLALEVSAKLAELSVRRLKCLELGLSGRGITSLEAERLAEIYGIAVSKIMNRAATA